MTACKKNGTQLPSPSLYRLQVSTLESIKLYCFNIREEREERFLEQT